MNKESEDSCYVRATCNYHYTHKGREINMRMNEVFLLIKKTNDDWWQVVRSGEHKAFFAPSKYLELTNISVDAMKSSLRKKVAHQRHLQNQQRMFEESRKQKQPTEYKFEYSERSESPPIIHPNDMKMNQIKIEREFYQKEAAEESKHALDTSKTSSFVTSSWGVNNNNNGSNLNEEFLNCSIKPTTNFSFIPNTNGNEENEAILNKSVDGFRESTKSINMHERASICNSFEKNRLTGEFESISTHTSKSSLNDCSRSSIESFSQLKVKGNMMGKAASFDVLQSEDENVSVLNKNYQKAASSEELDHRFRRKEFLFQSDRLSHRNRSNSVELKRFDNNLDLSECERLTSLEKRKCRITRDPMNRRRSWALNEYQSHNAYQKIKGNDFDASIILDMPPKLPPKLKKNVNTFLSSSSDNLNNSDYPFNELKEEGLSRLCEEKVFEVNNSFSAITNRREKNKPFVASRRIASHDESDNEERTNSLEDPQEKRMPSKLSGWKRIQEAVTSEKITSIPKEVIPSIKEKRVEELIEKIESQSKILEKEISVSKPKKHFQVPSTPTDPPRRLVFDDWGEYVDRETSRPFYFNPKTMEKSWKPPRKSICSSITSEAPQIVCEKSSLKGLKVPSPVLPPNSNLLLWPNRERSFTSSGHLNTSNIVNHKLHSSISLNPDKTSLTLPANPPSSAGIPIPSKGSHTLPSNPLTPKDSSPTPKSSRSFFSAISSSLSFIKHSSGNHSNTTNNSECPSPASSHSPPQVPPSSAKPQHLGGGSNCSTPGTPSSLESLNEEPEHVTLQLALERFHIPRGWIRKYDALSHQVYFESLVTGEKWNPAIDKCGTIYVYSASGGESKWTLQEYDDVSPSLHSPSLTPFERDKEEALREDILNWRVMMKDGKKAKKSWSTSYAKYYPNMKKNIYGKSFGSITFAKKLNDTKKVECFDLVPPCFIDFNLKKQNCFCIRNGDLWEILIQADTPTIATEWTKLLIENDKVQEKNLGSEKEKEKKTSKGGDKVVSKKDSQDDTDATKGIKDSLMLFFKRRIQQETLAKKGIYKDTVFGSTIGDLCLKEKLETPVFVLQCIKNIEKNTENFKVDGLYRISGNASKIQKIRIEIAQNRYSILEEEKDVHNLTGALKLFFRELKEPLIPFANYVSFIQATDHVKTKSRVEALRLAAKKLPTCNRETLKILLDHLLKINEYEQENRMSIMNLAIVFGPCLLWPETTSGFDLMTDAMLHNRVVESLLSLFDEVFRKK